MSDIDKTKKGFLSRLFGGKPKDDTDKAVPSPVKSPDTDNPSDKLEINLTTKETPAEEEPPAETQQEDSPEPIEEKKEEEEEPAFSNNSENNEAEQTTETAQDVKDEAGQPIPDTDPEKHPAQPERLSWWQRLTRGLGRTSSSLSRTIFDLFSKRKLDADTMEDLEDALIQADLGLDVAARITKQIGEGRFDKHISPDEVRQLLATEIETLLADSAQPLVIDSTKKPFVILMTGVNGAGKTTTIGKLASKFRKSGHKVMLAAGDTFRAAAIDQLKVWGERTGCPVVTHKQGADAAGLAFDAVKTAQEQNMDILMIDTAGRLQNKTGLMDELEKIVRVIKKLDETAPHACLLVLDATVGQNAISQVETFQKTAGVTGLVMTKLDGTARGGILVALASKFALPIHFIGVGESVEDLEPFSAHDFACAIAGLENPDK